MTDWQGVLQMGNPESAKIALRDEIIAMARVDQDVRRRWLENRGDTKIAGELHEIDMRNTARMREIVETFGWPGKSLVGESAAQWAWCLVQHADSDRELQQRCLDLMTAAGPDEVSPRTVAYLVDRLKVACGEPQVYGTQFATDAEGKFGPLPIENVAQVDERRSAVGLETLEEYRQSWR